MKKLLFIFAPPSSFRDPMIKTFKRFDFDVLAFDFRDNPVLKTGHFVYRFVNKMPKQLSAYLKSMAEKSISLKILKTARAFKPDYVFVVRFPEMDLAVLDELRKTAVTMNYYPETMDNWDRMRVITSHYDYFLNYDSYVVELLKKENIGNPVYMPFSADIDENAQWSAPEKFKYNITFIGTYSKEWYAERETILNAVKDLGLNIWGNKLWLDTSLRDYYRGRPSMEDMADIYRNSCIGINADISTEIAGTGINLRPFEITATGAMLLNRDDRKDIFNLFKDGEEFSSFHTAAEAREKAEYYLSHVDERNKIARAGFERSKRDHTYIKRFSEIFDLISNSVRK